MTLLGKILRGGVLLSLLLSCSGPSPVPQATGEGVSGDLTHPRVTTIAEDGTGHVWVGTTHGLNRALPYGYHWYLAGDEPNTLSDNHISRLFRDSGGRLWVASINGQLCYLTPQANFAQVRIEYKGNVQITFAQLPDGSFYCDNEYGIYRYVEEEERMERIIDGDRHNLGFFADGNDFLVAYPDKICRYSANGALLASQELTETCRGAIMDPDGDLWLSLGSQRRLEILSGGVFLSLPGAFRAHFDGKEIHDICGFGEDKLLLVNTVDNLLLADKQSWSVMSAREAGLPLDQGQYDINCIHYDGTGNVWVGTDGGGVRILANTRKGSRFHALVDFFKNKTIQDIAYEHADEMIYVTTRRGDTFRYSLRDNTTPPEPVQPREVSGPGSGRVLQLSDGRVLTVENNKDLILSSPGGATATLLPLSAVKQALGSSHFIPEALFEDSLRQIWIGTQSDGVVILDPDSHIYKKISSISCPEISSISQVGDHVWVATQYGLNEYELDGTLVDSYLGGSGSNAYTERCACVLPSGILLLGTMQGLVVRYPFSQSTSFELPFFFEDLKVRNILVRPGPSSPVDKAMVFAPDIKLKHGWNTISISFASLDYRNAIHGSYSYMLEGFDPFWIDAGESHEAFYSNLPPGHYTFRARLSDKSGSRSFGSAAVKVNVRPAPWASLWARILYLLAASGLLFGVVYTWQQNRRKQENARRLEEEKKQEQRMGEINKQYFANVAHQLRTPLTMISGPIGTLCEAHSIKGGDKKLLKIIRHNTDRMLHLVNQIMDFNALETDALALKVRRLDILPTLRNTLDIYQVNAREKGIAFLSDGLDGNAFVHADADKIVNILDNLLSNAFKFTPSGGVISVSFTEMASQACLKVSNSGPSIPENKLERIFERYYQIDGQSLHGRYNWGSGVGLYYARKLALLHHGTLTCANAEDGAGVCFTLLFPTSAEEYSMEEKSEAAALQPLSAEILLPEQPQPEEGATGLMKPSVLVVDDDSDITYYLRTLLSPYYQVSCCYDVESAEKLLAGKIPDIILSDVMMNGQTGLDFCSYIKGELQYCHIPVVLLTAKDSVRDQIDGLKVGADAYVTKPFNAEYLISLIDNLLKSRQLLRGSLSENAGMDLPGDSSLSPQDRAFLKDLYALMDEELSNSEFNIGDIVDKLHISHSKFLYKVKGLTGVTPSELFKNYKLNKAAAMLREGKYNISEVSDLTGFSSLAHFSKVFKKKFGVPPSEFK